MEKQQQQQMHEQDEQQGGQAAQQQRQQASHTPFSANAPTPPLTTSAAAGGPISSQQTPSSSSAHSTPQQQQQMPPAGYYSPYGRYPPPGAGTQPSDFYAAGPTPPGMYTPAQQQAMWGPPYGMQQQPRYPPAGTPIGRYPYPTAAAGSVQPPVAANSPLQQPSAQQSQQQQQQPGSSGSSRTAAGQQPAASMLATTAKPMPGGGPLGFGTRPPAGMLPAAPNLLPPYGPQPLQQQTQQQFPAWFGAAITLGSQPHTFPPHTLEAQAIGQLQQIPLLLQQQRYRRPKLYARDLYGASPARIVMALRSGLHLETCWALNALNIQLYDDTTPNAAPQLAQMPELLNLLVQHFAASLSMLFPKQFNAKLLGWSSSGSKSPHPVATTTTAKTLPPTTFQLTKSNSSQSTASASWLVPKREPGLLADHNGTIRNNSNNNGNGLLDLDRSESVSLMVRPPQSIMMMAASASMSSTNNVQQPAPNFTMVSRLGRHVKLDTGKEMPPELARELESWAVVIKEEEEEDEGMTQDEEDGKEEEPFPDFVARIRRQMIQNIRQQRALKRSSVLFKRADALEDGEARKKKDFWEMTDELSEAEEEETERKSGERRKKEEKAESEQQQKENLASRLFFYRSPLPWERWDRNSMGQCALVSRQTVLQNGHADELLAQQIDRCLALSNILRGFSFLPGQERPLAQHQALLRLLPALLMLMVDPASQKHSGGQAPKQFTFPRPEEEEEEEAMELDQSSSKVEAAAADESATSTPTKSQQQQRASVPAERDSRRKWLLEVANQLRDDAFTMLAHASPHLDLFDWDNTVSWSLLDSLLHWSVSTELQARDPLPPFGVIPPRHYALEILCKMSVLERNVDLLVSTGPWPRLEEFVRLLCSFICEEPPLREFAIVILNAVCSACEPACYVAAVETALLEHLVSFLEAADANMTQIAQQQGIHTLRENPEIIGTSVGMLRRAALIMIQVARHERCRDQFQRLQHRLLQFTVSHFMDSRVAAMVADILFEMQRSAGDSQSANSSRRQRRRHSGEARNDQRSNNHHQNSSQQGPMPRSCLLPSSTAALVNATATTTAADVPSSTTAASSDVVLLFNGGGASMGAASAEMNGDGGGDRCKSSSSRNSSSALSDAAAENNNNMTPPAAKRNASSAKKKTNNNGAGNKNNGSGGGGGGNSSRKRPAAGGGGRRGSSSTVSSAKQQQQQLLLVENNNLHCLLNFDTTTNDSGSAANNNTNNWNGHSHHNNHNHHHYGMAADSTMEKDQDEHSPVVEKRSKKAAASTTATVGVRERMRNNILGKQQNQQQLQQQQKKNGWIDTNTSPAAPLQNGTSSPPPPPTTLETTAARSGGAVEQKPQAAAAATAGPASPPTANASSASGGGGAAAGSLTAVA